MLGQIKLDDCPEVLRDAVNAEIAKWTGYGGNPELVSCTMFKSSNGAETTYKAYLFNLNTFTILTYIDTPPDQYKYGVIKDLITIGEIKEILRAAPEWFN